MMMMMMMMMDLYQAQPTCSRRLYGFASTLKVFSKAVRLFTQNSKSAFKGSMALWTEAILFPKALWHQQRGWITGEMWNLSVNFYQMLEKDDRSIYKIL